MSTFEKIMLEAERLEAERLAQKRTSLVSFDGLTDDFRAKRHVDESEQRKAERIAQSKTASARPVPAWLKAKGY